MLATRTAAMLSSALPGSRSHAGAYANDRRACAGPLPACSARGVLLQCSQRRAFQRSRSEGDGDEAPNNRRRSGRSVSGVTAALSSDEAEVLGSLDSLDDGGDDTLGNLVKILPVASLALLVGGGVVFKEPIVDNLNIFSDYLAGMGPSGFALYMAVYCGLELLAVPAIPLTMTAGALFGVIPGTIAASVAGTVAATGAFVAARYFLRQKVVDWAEQNPKFKAIDAAIADEGLKIVVLLRLSPLLPLSLSNYLYGLTSLELRPYVLGSWLGMLPGTFLYVQTGAVGMAVMGGGDLMGEGGGSVLPLVAGLGMSCLTAFYVTKVASKAVAELDGKAEDRL